MAITAQKTPVVLVADEDARIRARLKTAFETENHTVIEAPESESCWLACTHFHPDLLILTSTFSGALEICGRVKSSLETRHIAILLALADENDTEIEPFFQANIDDWVGLSSSPALLVHRARRMLNQQSLQKVVNFQGEILTQMADAVVAVDSNSSVIYWNAEAEQTYGIPAAEILGKPLERAYRIEGFTSEVRNEVVSNAARDGWRGEGVHIKQDGTRIPVEVSVRLLRDETNLGFGHITVVRDISERKRIEAALHEQTQLAQALHDTVSALTRTLDPQGVMRLILEHLGRVVPHTSANIMLIEGDKARVGFSRGYPPDLQAALEAATLLPYDIPNYHKMLVTGEPCLIPNTDHDPQWIEMFGWAWVRSYLGVPISAYDHVIGFLNVDSDQPNAFTPTHAERIRVFADQAAIAIENAQLYDAIYRDAVEMRTLHRATDFLYQTSLFSSDNLAEICEQIVRVVVNEFGKVDCGVLLAAEDSDTLVRVARAGAFQVNASAVLHLNGPGLVPAALRSGKTIYAPDVNLDERYVPSNPETASELVIPLRTVKGVIGVLDLQTAQRNAFDEHDIRLMEVFAERAATTIENIKLYNEVRRYAEELEARVQERTGELNRVKERVEAILNHSSDAILLVRTNGSIQQSNRSFDIMFGYRADETYGKPLRLLAAPSHEAAMDEALARVLENRNAERLEIVARRLNGLVFDADVTLSPVMNDAHEVTSIVGSLRDISPRKRLEMELREALQKERELNELKSRFVARASHEFRTPLAVILTSSDLLKNYGSRMSPEQRDEKIERLQKEARGIAVMLDDLLTISKGEELKEFDPILLDLQNLTREVVHEVAEGIGGQHVLTVESRGNCTSVYADKKLVTRIITNLLSNAIKYSPINSTIQVVVTCETTQIILEVKDQGIGIPDDDQVRLFEAFHRAKNVDHISGTGLGLAIVKQAVELHGGDVSVTSTLGKGSTFTVTLPNLAVKEKQP
jgi:PAS domain S-box-containing protein